MQYQKNLIIHQVALKVSDSDWSEKFSLDTAGSLGTVECKSKSHPSTVSWTFNRVMMMMISAGGGDDDDN